jgi:hypothetical protein
MTTTQYNGGKKLEMMISKRDYRDDYAEDVKNDVLGEAVLRLSESKEKI